MFDFQVPGGANAYAPHGMCATSHPMAASLAVDVLKNGGNAIDAAISASAMLCVVEPHMTGIGGDCFAMVSRPGKPVAGLNGSGRSGRAADADWLSRSGLEEIGFGSIHAVTVPGAVDAWDRLLRDFGTMSLGDALAPAIAAARDGFAVTPRVARDWAQAQEKLAGDEGAARHYLARGRAPGAGDLFRSPALARTLRIIADEGRDAFYNGEIAADIVATLRARGSLLTAEDFAATRASPVTPISVPYRGHDILELPPNGQGAIALAMFRILEQFDLCALDPGGAARLHLECEAARLAHEAGARVIADPDLADISLDHMLSDETAGALAARIDPARRGPRTNDAAPAGSDTVYITVVDKDRMAVSFINSLYQSFGSGIATIKTGIMLHCRGAGFATDPAHPNCIAPAKRPFHTIIPAMLAKEGRVLMPFGVMGAHYQPQGHAHVVTNILDFAMDFQCAIDDARVFANHGLVEVEHGISEAVAGELAGLGHDVVRAQDPLGGAQLIHLGAESGVLAGASDPRKDGLALGY